MPLSVEDIVAGAITLMVTAGAVILFSAWRHAVRIERAAKQDGGRHLSPAE